MRTFSFTAVKEKEFTVTDFSALTDSANGYYAGKTLTPAPTVKETGRLKSGLHPVRAYNVGYGIFYCSDGKLYREENGEYKAYGIPAFATAPTVFTVSYDGVKTIAVVGDTGAYLLNDGYTFVQIVKGSDYVVYKNILFIAKGRKILVCGKADYTGDKVTVSPNAFLYPEGKFGAVTGFAVVSSDLFAVCARGAVKITVTGDDMEYALKDCGLPPFKCVAGSVCALGNEAYFFGAEGLTRFNGSRAEKVKSLLDGKNFVPCGKAVAKENLYLFPVNLGGDNLIYCMDVLNGKDCFIDGEHLSVGDNGITAAYYSGAIGEIDLCRCDRVWKSVKTDLDFSGEKTVFAAVIDGDVPVSVKLESDGLSREFTLSPNKKEYLSLRGREFTVTLTTENSEVNACSIRSLSLFFRK